MVHGRYNERQSKAVDAHASGFDHQKAGKLSRTGGDVLSKRVICTKCIAKGADTSGYKEIVMKTQKLRCDECERMRWCRVFEQEERT